MIEQNDQNGVRTVTRTYPISRSGPKLGWGRRTVAHLGDSLLLWTVLSFLIFAVLSFIPRSPQWQAFIIIPIGLTMQFVRQKRLQRLITHLVIATDCGSPLPQYLYAATVGETRKVAHLLKKVAGSLEKGNTLAQSIKLAAPWASTRLLECIRLAEVTGSLPTELHRLEQPSKPWPVRHELTLPLVFAYLIVLWFAVLLQIIFYRAYSHFLYAINDRQHGGAFRIISTIGHDIVSNFSRRGLILLAFATYVLILAYFLRMTFAGGYYHFYIFRRIRNALSWRLPLLRSLARWKSWSITAGILARAVDNNLPLPEALDAAAYAQNNFSARRRLIRSIKLLQRGASPDKAFRKAGLPKSMRIVLAGTSITPASSQQPNGIRFGSLPSALCYLECYYSAKYMAAIEWLESLIIPLAVILLGAGVLAVGQFVFVPYSHLIQLVESKGCF